MGRKAKLPIDLIIPLPDRIYQNEEEFIRETQMRFQTMFKYMKKNTDTTFTRNPRTYAGTTANYRVDDKVWVSSKRKVEGRPMKITDGWCGPYRVTRIMAELLLEVMPTETAGCTFTTHVCRVRPFSGNIRNQKYRPDREPIEGTDEVVEEVGHPDEWIDDNLLIPIEIDREPPDIRDLTRPAPPVPYTLENPEPGPSQEPK
jgi:hypothetical protein